MCYCRNILYPSKTCWSWKCCCFGSYQHRGFRATFRLNHHLWHLHHLKLTWMNKHLKLFFSFLFFFTFSLKSTVHRITPQRASIHNSPASLIYICDDYSLETSVLVSAPLSELIMGMRMDNKTAVFLFLK